MEKSEWDRRAAAGGGASASYLDVRLVAASRMEGERSSPKAQESPLYGHKPVRAAQRPGDACWAMLGERGWR